MEVITFQSEVYKDLVQRLDEINSKIGKQGNLQPLSERYLDIQETCQLLKVSKRTLQAYRDKGFLSFSQIAGKIYFRASDIEEHLKKHYIKAFKNQ
jgi:hypothetical protein